MDLEFPIIEYEAGQSPRQWGLQQGESYRSAIQELANIRRELMLSKNPRLSSTLDALAAQQWRKTQDYMPTVWQELDGIVQGSSCSVTDIVILNNYTDFRDICFPEEGCSTVYLSCDGSVLAGQTWDMHCSARDYVCALLVPPQEAKPACLLLSVVGSVGMLGYNSLGTMVGVNNLNTVNATCGVLWPALVRHALEQNSYQQTRNSLSSAPIAGGRHYLIASRDLGEGLEVSPQICEEVARITASEGGYTFHTNHCLSETLQKLEDVKALSSTTHGRYALLQQLLPSVQTLEDLEALLSDHTGFPKSICSHFETGVQDPAFTCAAVAADLLAGDYVFWRGCSKDEALYRRYTFHCRESKFQSVSIYTETD